MKLKPDEVNTMLPAATRQQLIEASRVEPEVAPGSSINRTMEVDRVTRLAKRRHPHLFR